MRILIIAVLVITALAAGICIAWANTPAEQFALLVIAGVCALCAWEAALYGNTIR
jgi:hypothetical protein